MSEERPQQHEPARASTPPEAADNPSRGAPEPTAEPARARLEPEIAHRWPVAGVAALHCAAFTCAALLLPWQNYPLFSSVTALVALGHAATLWTALGKPPWLARFWRATSWLALVWLLVLTWSVGTSAWYMHRIYGALGNGIAMALLIGWCIPILFTIPFSAWGLAATRKGPTGRSIEKNHGEPKRGFGKLRAAGPLSALIVGLLALLTWHKLAEATTSRLVPQARQTEQLDSLIVRALPAYSTLPAATELAPPLSLTPSDCDSPVTQVGATLFVQFRARHRGKVLATQRCVQAETLEATLRKAKELLEQQALQAPIKLDLVVGHSPLSSGDPLLDGFKLRPGLDGVCQQRRCLLGWQLAGRHMLNQHDPIKAIPELRMGFSAARVREAFGTEPLPTLDGLRRIETRSYLYSERLERLSRMHLAEQPVDLAAVARAEKLAETHILRALGRDGRYRYQIDPFSGVIDSEGYSLPRQAGTTLVLCEFGSQQAKEKQARAALKQMASLELRSGVKSLLLPEPGERFIPLGNQALPLIAFLACRDAVGQDFDKLIGRLARTVLALQTTRGDFHPEWDLDRYEPQPGPPPLFSPGQAVMGLVLLERAIQSDSSRHFPKLAQVRAAVDRAMRFYGEEYWDFPLGPLFYVEENWHCLAARAALQHHRVDSYERLCIDHAQFKANFTITEDSPTQDMVGAFALAPLIPPPNTATAGVGEALAAAIAIKQARGEDVHREKAQLDRILRFLLRQQWTRTTCFACQNPELVIGGFSDSMLTPTLRIDFTQHAWAAIAHGSRLLELPQHAGRP